MTTATQRRMMTVVAIALSSGACATSSNVFARHEGDMAERALREATADRAHCPVVECPHNGKNN